MNDGLEWVIRVLLRRVWAILMAVLVCAGGSVLGSYFLVTPQYESSVILYVSQTQSRKDLADSLTVVVTMRESLMEVIRSTQLNTSHLRLQKQVRVEQRLETDFLEVIVSSSDPTEAVIIANAIGSLLPQQVEQIMEGTRVKLVGEALPALEPTSPNYGNNALLGGILGGLAAMGLVLLQEFWKKEAPNWSA